MIQKIKRIMKGITRCINRRTLTAVILSVSVCMLQTAAGEDLKKADAKLTTQTPSLDELAGDWMQVKSLRNLPSVNNFHGGLKTTRDISAIQFLTFPPLSQGGHSGSTFIDGKQIRAQESRWYPHQVMRRTSQDGLKITSATRMVFESQGVLIRIEIHNPTEQPRPTSFRLDLNGKIRRFDGRWQWNCPRPNDDQFDASLEKDNHILLIGDRKSKACAAYAFARRPDRIQVKGEKGIATWKLKIEPGQTVTLDYVMAVGEDNNTVRNTATGWAQNFGQQFQEAKDLWGKRWQDAFTPDNKHFSGHLPTLITKDKKLRRVYYMAIASAMQLYRTNLPKSDRVFVTAGPQWAVSLVYFWDAEMWATTWSLLEPTSMKEHLKAWLSMDYHRCYARDYLSGQGAGPWYSANDWSIFNCVDAYLRTTGDADFLKEEINGKTLLKHLEDLATNYRKFVRQGDIMADYGTAVNLLECVPTYIHRVPSFNAANVWMLRRTADFHQKANNIDRARKLRREADRLMAEVLELYLPGQGVWCSLHRDGKKVEMRHVFDFIVAGQSLSNSLGPDIKKEMMAFVNKELFTKNWMRAQSLSDIAAKDSDRPDHGPMGSYDGWPPLTMDVMCLFGEFDTALAFLHRTEEVTYEGPFAQSHELLGRENDAPLRIANRGGQDFNEGCGAAFADVIIRSFFGYRPEIDGKIKLLTQERARGFHGELHHLSHHGSLYTLTSDRDGVRAKKE